MPFRCISSSLHVKHGKIISWWNSWLFKIWASFLSWSEVFKHCLVTGNFFCQSGCLQQCWWLVHWVHLLAAPTDITWPEPTRLPLVGRQINCPHHLPVNYRQLPHLCISVKCPLCKHDLYVYLSKCWSCLHNLDHMAPADCRLNISQTIDTQQSRVDSVISADPIWRETCNAAGGGVCQIVEIRPNLGPNSQTILR